jgi:hypothetical protein
MSAIMEQDMEEWARNNTVEQRAQDEPEQIRVAVSSSSRPPGTAMNTDPNEVAIKRQRVGVRRSSVYWALHTESMSLGNESQIRTW